MTTINNDLPELNHDRIPIGVGWRLRWGVGGVNGPQDLTNSQAVLILNPGVTSQIRFPLTTDTAWATLHVDDLDWHGGSKLYVLEIADVSGVMIPRVRGSLTSGVRVNP